MTTACVVELKPISRTPCCSHKDIAFLDGLNRRRIKEEVFVDGKWHSIVEMSGSGVSGTIVAMINAEGQYVNFTAPLYIKLIGGQCDASFEK